nr:MAG TPA: peptidase [Microviridae sp.]
MAIYFNIEEMTKSQTAELYHIDNTPTEKVIGNLKKVMYILDMVRVYIGKPILINSGYRCEKLNEMVGGVQKSMHTKGLAADFRTEKKEDINIIFEFLKKNQKKFKIIELIKYTNFIHMGVSETLTI